VANLRSPAAILLHAILLVVFLYHTLSWFQVMPKTMAPVVVGGRKVPACAITGAGLVASLVASVGLFVVIKAIS
jgi:fumarate reductase subunit C